MPMIADREREKLVQMFNEELKGPVKTVLFTSKSNCEYCDETEQLLSELSDISGGKITLEKHDFDQDRNIAERYGIDKTPAIVIPFGNGTGIRYYGIPGGYEFTSLIGDIVDVSSGSSKLPEDIRNRLKDVDRNVHIQVFVTPTCPWCPKAVRTAHQFAMENSSITSDMVEATEFPDLASSFSVMAVPKIVINGDISFEGAMPEQTFLDYVLKSIE
ncbi:MAG: thioredoxin family protein [Thermoplasmata archaeon]|nr:thioredoxin family protein [Candidatus Sysuiplasma acidicola]MBX8646000.1 thioredoxin family protein [Candidatus Sysuiplasma acidicola]MDH2905705.1 thioredoxin family protein [Methanomassiliicoccales archaeon]